MLQMSSGERGMGVPVSAIRRAAWGARCRAVAASRPSAQGLREALRAYVVDPRHHHDTVVGDVGFDVNGDSVHQYVTFFRIDPSAAGGKGDWVIAKQQDYGPAP